MLVIRRRAFGPGLLMTAALIGPGTVTTASRAGLGFYMFVTAFIGE